MTELGEELARALDETAPDVAPGTLEAIVARRDRRRARALGVATAASVVVALAAVSVAALEVTAPSRNGGASALAPVARVAAPAAPPGAALSKPPGAAAVVPGPARAAAPARPGGIVGSAADRNIAPSGLAFWPQGARLLAAGCAGESCGTAPLAPLSRSTQDGTAVREFTTGAERSGTGRCSLAPALVVEVSDERAVGVLEVALPLTARRAPLAIDEVAAAVVGAREGAPMLVVVVHTDAAVARLSVAPAGGAARTVVPVDGWAVLSRRLPGPATSLRVPFTVTATAGSGSVLATARVTGEPAVAVPRPCAGAPRG